MMNFNNDDYQNRNQDRQFVREQQYDRNYGNYAPQKPELDFEPKKEKSSGGGLSDFLTNMLITLLLCIGIIKGLTYLIKWKNKQDAEAEQKAIKKEAEDNKEVQVSNDEISSIPSSRLINELFRRKVLSKIGEKQNNDPLTAHKDFREKSLQSMTVPNSEENDDEDFIKQFSLNSQTNTDQTGENNTGTGGDNSDITE